MLKRALVVGVLALGAASAAAGPDQMKRVTGQATMSSSICGGGAAITDEQIARLPPPQPIAGREFLVVAGTQISPARPAARFTTRPDGTFVTRLPPGTWCFFEAGRRPSAERKRPGEPPVAHASIDAGCLEAEALRCDLVLAVKTDVSRARISFTQRCPQVWNQPCYRGPMPP